MRSAKRDARLTLQHREHQYVALKIYIHNSAQHRELPFYEKLNKALPSRHIGAENIRKLTWLIQGQRSFWHPHRPSASSLSNEFA